MLRLNARRTHPQEHFTPTELGGWVGCRTINIRLLRSEAQAMLVKRLLLPFWLRLKAALSDLRDLCVSAVNFFTGTLTAETPRTQRTRRENRNPVFG
jgi:hypothetical protein